MDFKKTILWAVFSMSGLMLYNNWQVHEGKPSLFGGAQVSAPAAADKTVTTNKVDVPAQISGSPVVAATPAATSGAIESADITE
jgi:YidC/Oxa1 family membrane protein insertase